MKNIKCSNCTNDSRFHNTINNTYWCYFCYNYLYIQRVKIIDTCNDCKNWGIINLIKWNNKKLCFKCYKKFLRNNIKELFEIDDFNINDLMDSEEEEKIIDALLKIGFNK